MKYHYRNPLHREFHDLLCDEALKRNERPDWVALPQKPRLS